MSDGSGGARPSYGVNVPEGPPEPAAVTRVVIACLLGGLLAVVGLTLNLVVALAVIPPLVVFLTARGDAFVRDEARRALNFQITWAGITLILQVVAFAVTALLTVQRLYAASAELLLSFLLVQLLVAVFDLVVSVLAAVRAARGGGFGYPLTIPFVK
jgi:uncharacterized Tic20 family protein